MKTKEVRNTEEKFLLEEQAIPQVLEKIKAFMRAGKMKDTDITIISSSFEKALKKWSTVFQGKQVIVYLEKKFRSYQIEVVLPNTEANDPFEEETEDNDNHYSELYRNLSDSYAYVIYMYQKGGNTLLYNFRKTSGSSLPMIIAFVSAIICGCIFRFAAKDVGLMLSENLIDPLCTKFISMLTMVASPMMFFLLLNTICKLGTRRELSDLGKKLLTGIWLTIVIMAVAGIGLCMVTYGFGSADQADSQSANQFAAIRDLLLNIIPDSIFAPFLTGNALQIIFLALIIGIAIFIKKTQNKTLIKVNDQLDGVFQMLMTVINNIMPFYIFLSLTSLIITVDFSEFTNLWKLFVLFFASILLYFIILVVKIVITTRKSPFNVLKAIIPAYLTALMTASSLAAFNPSLLCCTDKFSIPEKEAKFYLSTGRTVYKPASTGSYIMIACFFAYISGNVNMSVSWYVMALITCIILGLATPPIPGGAKTCYTILFLQLGISAHWLALVIALDALFDFFCTSSDVAGLLIQAFTIHTRSERKKKKQ